MQVAIWHTWDNMSLHRCACLLCGTAYAIHMNNCTLPSYNFVLVGCLCPDAMQYITYMTELATLRYGSSQSKSKTASASVGPNMVMLASRVDAYLSQLSNCAAGCLLCLTQAILKLLTLHRPKHAMQAIGDIDLESLIKQNSLSHNKHSETMLVTKVHGNCISLSVGTIDLHGIRVQNNTGPKAAWSSKIAHLESHIASAAAVASAASLLTAWICSSHHCAAFSSLFCCSASHCTC